jgi:predicted nuclease of predicted toxin-antitoxin system
MARLKLDEDLDPRIVASASLRGHDAESVWSEGVCGASDEALMNVCLAEHRTLVTLHLDFADPLRFPPASTRGIIVLRPGRATLPLIGVAFDTALQLLGREDPRGALWIVEPGRLRIRGDQGKDEPGHADRSR